MPPKKKVYSKKDPIDHVLLRPSMYVGSKTFKTCEEYIATFEDNEDEIDEFLNEMGEENENNENGGTDGFGRTRTIH